MSTANPARTSQISKLINISGFTLYSTGPKQQITTKRRRQYRLLHEEGMSRRALWILLAAILALVLLFIVAGGTTDGPTRTVQLSTSLQSWSGDTTTGIKQQQPDDESGSSNEGASISSSGVEKITNRLVSNGERVTDYARQNTGITDLPYRKAMSIVQIGLQRSVPSAVDGVLVSEAFVKDADSEASMSRFTLEKFDIVHGVINHRKGDKDTAKDEEEVGLSLATSREPLFYPLCSRSGACSTGADEKGQSVNAAPYTSADEEEIRSSVAPYLGRGCPLDRFLTVNTHTWGRHHNQLQEIMNTIAWADRLNRTAIISYFRFKSAWHSAEKFYDFTEIQKRYCVVTHREAEGILRIRDRHTSSPKLTSRCLGQGTKGTRFRHLPNVLRCPSRLDLPAHYNARHSVRISKKLIADHVLPNNDGFLMLSGQIAFYMRPGLWEISMLFRHLKPSVEVQKLVNAQLRSRFFPNHPASVSSLSSLQVSPLDRIAATVGSPTSQTLPGAMIFPYFSIHSRSREVDCLLEMSYDEGDNGGFLSSMQRQGTPPDGDRADTTVSDKAWDPRGPVPTGDSEVWRMARKQCRIGLDLVDKIVDVTRPKNGTLLFLASDGQNAQLEAEMRARGAVKVTDNFGGDALISMAVDFFLMTMGLYFTGNQLSSVSQNVCFVRLGNGLTCDGWYPIWTLYHARNALSQSIGVPP